MALTHSTAARNAASDAVVDRIDLGSGTATGKLKLRTSGDVLLSTHNFANPAFGNSSTGVATANAIASANSAAAGTAAKFEAVDRDDAIVFSGTVTATGGGGDLTMDNPVLANGQEVQISSMTYRGESQ